MKINNTFKLIISLIISQVAGGLGSFFKIGSDPVLNKAFKGEL